MKTLKRHVKDELSSYLQNELDKEQTIYVENHLAVCKDCKKECEEIEQGIFWASQIQKTNCPESLWNNIEDKLNTQTQVKTPDFKGYFDSLFPPRTWVRVSVVAVALIIFIPFFNSLLKNREDIKPLAIWLSNKKTDEKNEEVAVNSLPYSESYSPDGRPQRIQPIPTPSIEEGKEKAKEKGNSLSLKPSASYKTSQPGSVLRVFERGNSLVGLPSNVGSPDPLESSGKSNTSLPKSGVVATSQLDPTQQNGVVAGGELPTNKRSFLDFSLTNARVRNDRSAPTNNSVVSGLSFNGQSARANNVIIDSDRESPPVGFVGPKVTVRVDNPIKTNEEVGDFIPADDRWRIGSPESDRNNNEVTKNPSNNQLDSEGYKNYGVNPWTSTKKDSFSTFAVDVDTGSYTIARRKLTEGMLPPADSVRVEELVNYFTYNYPQPATKHPFSLTMEASVSPFESDRYFLRVGLKGKEIAEDRLAAHLTFLVDTSGSMQSEDKIELVKKSLKMLVNHLKPEDTVAITTYAGEVSLVLPPTQITNKALILEAINGLESDGATAMEAGIDLAYKQALNALKPRSVNRVIICSDGDANIGETEPEEILKQIEGYVEQGITVSTIGFGMGNYKDVMMEQFANKGNGNYYYIDTIDQAKRVFVEQLTGTLQVIAKDVKVQVEFNPSTVSEYRLVGYENRDIADKDFRNDQVDAGEIGAGHTVTAIYEIKLQKQPTKDLAVVRLRYKTPDASKETPAEEVAASLDLSRIQQNFNQSSEDFRFAVSVAAFAENLRNSQAAKTWSLDKIVKIAQNSLDPNNQERQEFLTLVKKANQLKQNLQKNK
jgi:Ca-activated chloride channel family protein